ncbi:hypothetical protein [Bacillus pumilus]|nr:hypothetical protein [Bacillus pumilus]
MLSPFHLRLRAILVPKATNCPILVGSKSNWTSSWTASKTYD